MCWSFFSKRGKMGWHLFFEEFELAVWAAGAVGLCGRNGAEQDISC